LNKRLYNWCRKLRLSINNAYEVGVYYPENCTLRDFIKDGVNCTLIEADPACTEKLKESFRDNRNVKIINKAVWDKNESVTLYRTGSSTFIEGIPGSPAVINDNYALNDEDKFQVEGIRFSSIDNGKIDLLSVDIEGAEWYVLEYLTSRPVVISLEMQAGLYRNPFYKQITAWLGENGYRLWYKNDTDNVYIKKGIVKFRFIDLVQLYFHNFWESAKQEINFLKKKIKKALR